MYKLVTEMTNEEITLLWKDIFQINKITNIERRPEDNEIDITFTMIWECEDDNGNNEEVESEDTITMYSDNFENPSFSIKPEDKLKYKQYMIAKGYSSYWKDNPYV